MGALNNYFVLFFLLNISLITAENLNLINQDNTYTLYFKNKQRYVVHRTEESPYKNFFLYVEEIYKTNVIYPIKYLFEIPLKYYERLKLYKKKEINKKNLKEFCKEKKKIFENKDNQQNCFCCYCRQSSTFPLFSHLKYKKAKFSCNKEDKEDVVLTLSCLRKSEKKYHGFFIQQNSNFFMLNVTLQQFDLNDEYFININDKSALERKTYLLDPSNFEIDDEIFNVKLKFNVEKTHKNDSIQGSYLFIDVDTFKERIILKDSFTENTILKNSVIVNSDEINEKGDECNKLTPYPYIWEKKEGLCTHKRNFCFKKQLNYFLNLEKKIDPKKLLFHNYSFLMIKKSHLNKYINENSLRKDAYITNNKEETENEKKEEKSLGEDANGKEENYEKKMIKSKTKRNTENERENENEHEQENNKKYVEHDEEKEKKSNNEQVDNEEEKEIKTIEKKDKVDKENKELNKKNKKVEHEENMKSMINNTKDFIEYLEDNYYLGIEKQTHNFIEIKSHNNEKLNIFFEENNQGESVSFVHTLSNCYDFNNELDKFCTIYISIWNKENVDKELEIFINCEKQIVKDVSQLKKKIFLCKRCENTITMKFEPIVDLLLTPCNVLITKNTEEEEIEKKKKKLSEHNDKEEYFLFGMDTNEIKEENVNINIIKNIPLKYEVSIELLEHHLKKLDFLEDIEDKFLIYKKKFTYFMTKSENIIKIIIFLFFLIAFFIFVIPSIPICKNVIIKLKWYHNLKKLRMLIIWKIQDLGKGVKRIPYKIWRTVKRTSKKIKKLFLKIFFKFRKDEQLIDQKYKENLERKRRNEQKKKIMKIKYEKKKKEKEELKKRRYKKLLENEKKFKMDMEKEENKKRKKQEKKKEEQKRKEQQKKKEELKKKEEQKKKEQRKREKYTKKKESKKKNISSSHESYKDLEKNYSSTNYSKNLGSKKESRKHKSAKTNKIKNELSHPADRKSNRKEKNYHENGYSDYYGMRTKEENSDYHNMNKRRSISCDEERHNIYNFNEKNNCTNPAYTKNVSNYRKSNHYNNLNNNENEMRNVQQLLQQHQMQQQQKYQQQYQQQQQHSIMQNPNMQPQIIAQHTMMQPQVMQPQVIHSTMMQPQIIQSHVMQPQVMQPQLIAQPTLMQQPLIHPTVIQQPYYQNQSYINTNQGYY